MRIMITSDLHWPTINGVSTFGRNLARGLAKAGHEVIVVAPSQTGEAGEETDGNHRVVRTPTVVFPFYQQLRISLPPVRRLESLVNTFRPDVIHVQTPLGIGMATVHVARKTGVPLVATNHSMSENFIDNIGFLKPFAKPLDTVLQAYGRRFFAQAQHVTLPTQAAIDMLRPDGFRKPTSAISNGIDLSRFYPGDAPEGLRERFGIPQGVPIVLYVGRLDVEKHLHVLVHAARLALEEIPFHLAIVGLGIDRGRLEQLVNNMAIQKHVTFTGRVDEADKEDLFRVASVFAIPSPAELQSISTLEAMASGLPVVAVDAGALGELCIEGCNGLRFGLDDSEAMACNLVAILRDPELAERMGAASVEIANHHDINETIRLFSALYEQVVADYATAHGTSFGATSLGSHLSPAQLQPESPGAQDAPRSE